MTNQAVIFDMDGVIIDSEPLYVQADKHMLAEMGIALTKEQHDRTFGLNNADFWAYIATIDDKVNRYPAAELVERLNQSGLHVLRSAGKSLLIPGVLGWIKALDERGVKMIIASSSPAANIAYVLENFGVGAYIRQFVSGDMVQKGKPDPAIFLKAAATVQCVPECCIVIEDSQNGIKAAKSAGMKCAAYAPQGFCGDVRPDAVFAAFSEASLRMVVDLFNDDKGVRG